MTPRLHEAIRDTLRYLRNSNAHDLADALARLAEEDRDSLEGIELWPHPHPETWWVVRPYGAITREKPNLQGAGEYVTGNAEHHHNAEDAARAVIRHAAAKQATKDAT